MTSSVGRKKEGKNKKPPHFLEWSKEPNLQQMACAAWRHMYAYGLGMATPFVYFPLKQKLFVFFLRRFCRPIVLLVIISRSI